MNEYNVDMKTETEQTDVELHIDAEVIAEVPFPVPMDYSHDRLYDRDLPDQHPIKAITGLQDRLDEKVNKEAGKSLMTDAERVKLEGIETGAQVNLIEVIKTNGRLIPIENKTVDLDVDFTGTLGFNVGTRTLTLYGEKGEVLSTAVIPGEQSVGDNTTIVIKGDTVSIAPSVMAKLNDHVASKSNPHGVTKAQVGLGSVDNTADKDKPISTKTQAALNLKADQTELDKTNAEVAKKANQSALDATNVTVGTKADDAGVVHKAGTEDIVGIKTFRNRVDGEKSISLGMYSTYLVESQDTRLANRNQNPATDVENIIIGLADSTHFGYCSFSTRQKSNGSRDVGISLYTPNGWQEAGVKYDSESKNVSGFAPTTPSGSNGAEIVTAGYLNSAPTVVHTTGNETVSGDKTFKNSPTVSTWQGRYYIRSGTVETAVLGNKYDVCEFAMSDSKGNGFAWTRGRINEDLSSEIQLTALNKVGGQNKYASIGIKVGVDGKIIATAPVTPDGANGSEIVTAGWANGKYLPKINGLYESDGTSMWVRVLRLQTASYYTNEISLLRLFRFNNVGTYSTIAELELCNTCSEGGKHPDGGVRAFFKSSMGGFPVSQVHVYYNVDESPGIMEVWVNIQAKKYDYWTAELVDAVSRVSGDRYGEYDMTKVYATSAPAGLKEVEIDYPTAPVWKLGENDNSKHILTIEGANSLPSLVHTTGNQIIAGKKTFKDEPNIINDTTCRLVLVNNRVIGDVSSPYLSSIVLAQPKTVGGGVSNISYLNTEINSTSTYNRLIVRSYAGGVQTQATFDLVARNDGIKYATVPHRSTGQSNDDIVTYGMLKELGLIKG